MAQALLPVRTFLFRLRALSALCGERLPQRTHECDPSKRRLKTFLLVVENVGERCSLTRPAPPARWPFVATLLRVPNPYAARVAFICGDVGPSGPDPDPPSVLCRMRLTDDENHPRGGIASHPGRGCRIFSRSRKKSSTNEIVANSSSKFTSELGVRCTAWSKIQVNSRIIPTMTSMELPITPGPGVRTIRSSLIHLKVGGFRLSPVQKKFSVVPRFAATAAWLGIPRRVTLGETQGL